MMALRFGQIEEDRPGTVHTDDCFHAPLGQIGEGLLAKW
jgi:hypothetical protein